MADDTLGVEVLGDELSTLVPCVDEVAFPEKWMSRKVVAPLAPISQLLPLLAGTERFAPEWLCKYHLGGHAQRSYDVSCYFAQNVVVSGVGNLIVDGKLILSPEFTPDYWRRAIEADAFAGIKRELQLPQRVIDEKTVVGAGWGVNVYGHFLIEMLPRLWVAKKALGNALGEHKLLLHHGTEKWLLRIITGVLGFKESQIVFFDPHKETVALRNAILPTLASFNTHFHPVFNEIITDLLKATRADSALSLSRVYLSRALVSNPATPHRRCLNETRLAEIAGREYGFAVLAPETIAWPIQINIFHNADFILGEAGSGLHNAIFANKGARVGCIGFNNLTQSFIGALRDHQNAYFATSPKENGDFEVDEAAFRDFLTCFVRD